MIKVAIIAPNRAVRVGLRVLLTTDSALEVIGEGAALDETRHAPLAAADVMVVQGIPTTAQINAASLRGVLFMVDDGTSAVAPNTTLAWGLMPGDAAAEELIAATTALYHGLIVVHPDLAGRVFVQPARPVDDREPLLEPLTARELEVLQLIGQGLANKMIADRLHISEHTVKFHVSAIYAKLGVASRTEAVRAGSRRGLIVL